MTNFLVTMFERKILFFNLYHNPIFFCNDLYPSLHSLTAFILFHKFSRSFIILDSSLILLFPYLSVKYLKMPFFPLCSVFLWLINKIRIYRRLFQDVWNNDLLASFFFVELFSLLQISLGIGGC